MKDRELEERFSSSGASCGRNSGGGSFGVVEGVAVTVDNTESLKTILQGTVKGGRRQGRQRKRWEDKIREWTGLEFAKSQRAVENRENWRKLVVKLSVVPQRPSWLKDR